MTAMEVVIGDAEVCQLLDLAVEELQDDDVLGARLAARLSVALSHRAPLRSEPSRGTRPRPRRGRGRPVGYRRDVGGVVRRGGRARPSSRAS